MSPFFALRMSPAHRGPQEDIPSYAFPPGPSREGKRIQRRGKNSVGNSQSGSACPFHSSQFSSASRSSHPSLSAEGLPVACSAEKPLPSPSPCVLLSSACPPSAPVSTVHVQGLGLGALAECPPFYYECWTCAEVGGQCACHSTLVEVRGQLSGANSPIPLWVLGLQLRSQVCTGSTFTHRTISLTHFVFLRQCLPNQPRLALSCLYLVSTGF